MHQNTDTRQVHLVRFVFVFQAMFCSLKGFGLFNLCMDETIEDRIINLTAFTKGNSFNFFSFKNRG